jgi:hypothetical protein
MSQRVPAFYLALAAFAALALAFLLLRRVPRLGFLRRTRATNAVLATLSLLAAFIVAEGSLHFFLDVSDSSMSTLTSRRWVDRHLPRPYGVARGRQPGRDWTVPGPAFPVAVVGDSLTFGQGIERDEDLYPAILERELRARGLDAGVYNLSFLGWNTLEETKVLQKAFERGNRIKVVVLGYCLNDIGSLVPVSDKYTVELGKLTHPPPSLAPFVRRSFVASFLYNRYRMFASTDLQKTWESLPAAYRTPALFKAHADELKILKRMTSSYGANLVVLTFPVVNIPWERYPYRDIHAQLDAFWKSLDVENLDLLPALERHPVETLQASFLDSHPNELVHRLAAERLTEFLVKKYELPAAAGGGGAAGVAAR